MCKTEIEEITGTITKKIAEETDRLVEKILIEKGLAEKIRSKEEAYKLLAKLEEKNEAVVTRVKVNTSIGTITLFVDIVPRKCIKSWYESVEQEIRNGKV